MLRIRPAQSAIVLRWRRSPLALYMASFLFCLKGGILMIIWPWRIMSIGGESLSIGAIGGVWMGGYVLCCWLVGPHTDRIGVRRLVMTAAAASAGLTLLMPMTSSVSTFMTAAAASAGLTFLIPMTSSVAIFLALIVVDGAIAGLMWPPIAGWLTLGQEGHRLNRRLGMFSLSWALGATVGMLLGGLLWGPRDDPYPYLAFVAASCASIGTFIVAASARKQHPSSMPAKPVGTDGVLEAEARKISAFHWMAVIAGVIAGMTNGVIRYPIVTLMKSISLGPSVHGRISAAITIAMMFGLFLMGMTTRWHYKRMFLWVAQIAMAAAVCALALGGSAWELAICSVIASLGIAVVFASDLYYSLTGSTRRAARVAGREIRVSLGFAIGSSGGGALISLLDRFAEHQTSLRAIYPIMAGIIIAAVIVQIVIYYRSSSSRS